MVEAQKLRPGMLPRKTHLIFPPLTTKMFAKNKGDGSTRPVLQVWQTFRL